MEELNQLFDDHLFDFDKVKEKTIKLKEGERRMVSVLFADVKGFTSLSETLDHEEVQSLMDRIMKIFTHSVEIYGGYVDKYSGDQIMALFGAKTASEVDTQRAISSGIDMLNKLKKFNTLASESKKYKNSKIDLSIRIGINTGMVTTGKIGKEREGDFTVYGDSVNLAARMESNAPTNTIMIPEETMYLVKNKFEFIDNGIINVKNKSKPISVFIVDSIKDFNVNHESPFLGRGNEINLLTDIYNQCIKNLKDNKISKISFVGVHADAGVGKSRLIYEFIKDIHCEFSIGACSNVSSQPFHLFTSLIKDSFNISIIDNIKETEKKFNTEINKIIKNNPMREVELKESIPFLGMLLGLKIKDSRLDDKKEFVNHMNISLRTFLECLCTYSNRLNKPFILILEDIHWIDSMSYNTLIYILDTFNIKTKRGEDDLSLPIILSTFRNEYNPPKSLIDSSIYQDMKLNFLSKEVSKELITLLLGEIKITNTKKNELLKKSNGNPFFIEEWVNLTKETIDSNNQNIKQNVPNSLNSLILSRIDSLEKDLKHLLQNATVIGEEFFIKILSLLEEKLGLSSEIETPVNNLVLENFIQQYIQDKERYRFKHILTREVSYNTILKSNKKILHKAAAEVIEENFSESIENFYHDLSIHYNVSQKYNKAIYYLEKAGDKFDILYDKKKAVKCYEEILDILNNKKHTIKNKDVLQEEVSLKLSTIYFDLGEIEKASSILDKIKSDSNHINAKIFFNKAQIFNLRKDIKKSLELYNKALDIYNKLNNKKSIHDTYRLIGLAYINIGDFNNAFKYLQKSIEYFKSSKEVHLLIKSLDHTATIFIHQGQFDKAYKYCKEQYSLSTNIDAKAGIYQALGNMALINNIKGNYSEALIKFEELLLVFEDINDKESLCHTYNNIGLAYKNLKNYKEAIKKHSISLNISQELGDISDISLSLMNIGLSYYNMNNYSESLKYYKQASTYANKGKNLTVLSNLYGNLGNLYTDMGNLDDALKQYEKSYKIFKDINNIRGTALIEFEYSKIYIQKYDYAKAEKYLQKSSDILKQIGDLPYYIKATILLSRALRLNNKNQLALETIKNALKNIDQVNNEDIKSNIIIEELIIKMSINPKDSIKNVLHLYENNKNDNQKAYIQYNIWKYKNDKTAKQNAIELYSKLFKESPKNHYKSLIKELS